MGTLEMSLKFSKDDAVAGPLMVVIMVKIA
jgi:hypothetical protein